MNAYINKLSRLCIEQRNYLQCPLGRVAQSVTYLTADTCLTADLGVASWPGPVLSWRLIMKYFFTVILLPLADSKRVVVSYKRKYVHKVLVNRLVKPAQEKVWIGELTIST